MATTTQAKRPIPANRLALDDLKNLCAQELANSAGRKINIIEYKPRAHRE
jgi:hypothetical protein